MQRSKYGNGLSGDRNESHIAEEWFAQAEVNALNVAPADSEATGKLHLLSLPLEIRKLIYTAALVCQYPVHVIPGEKSTKYTTNT